MHNIPTFDIKKNNKKILQKKKIFMSYESTIVFLLTLLHSGRPKLYTILAVQSAIGLKVKIISGYNWVMSKK